MVVVVVVNRLNETIELKLDYWDRKLSKEKTRKQRRTRKGV